MALNSETKPSGELVKLKIEAYLDNGYSKAASPAAFTSMFNPTAFNRALEIEYEDSKSPGNSGTEKKFKGIKPAEFNLELLIDGTGASSTKADVAEKVKDFLDVCASYSGDIHRPNYLKINWASWVLKAVLIKVDISYTLFDKSGAPLRAKINASFSETMADEYRVREEKNKSPDLTHERTVLEGDTLPLMTHRIYGDSKYYLQIAQVNNLKNYRKLVPGQKLYFPPIEK